MAMRIYRYKFVGGDFSNLQIEVPMPVALVRFDCPVEIAIEITAEDSAKPDLDYYMTNKGYEYESDVTP